MVAFVFEEFPWSDLSASGNVSFATGTSLGFRARAECDSRDLYGLRV